MHKWIVFSIISAVLVGGLVILKTRLPLRIISPIVEDKKRQTYLLQYSYENLKKRTYEGNPIEIDKVIKDDPKFTSKLFFFTVDGKKVSGMINIPKFKGPHPIIVMIRGFMEPKEYSIGLGTQHAAEVFAQNGFVTMAPDFLGYGESDPASKDALEDRFLTYITVLQLLASVQTVYGVKNIQDVQTDSTRIGLWGHSNGGQIALSVLEISGNKYPTVLWAPVSISFPQSVLYYSSEFGDKREALRNVIADFAEYYSPHLFSATTYLSWIKASIQLHQGDKDEEVPKQWSDELYQKLKSLGVNIEYFTYPNENHNFNQPDEWSQNVKRNIQFYRQTLL